jgi:hypothetical protein
MTDIEMVGRTGDGWTAAQIPSGREAGVRASVTSTDASGLKRRFRRLGQTPFVGRLSTVFHNRVGWAKTHMKMAGLIENPSRGARQDFTAGTASARPAARPHRRAFPPPFPLVG